MPSSRSLDNLSGARILAQRAGGLGLMLVLAWLFSLTLAQYANDYWQQNILEMLVFVVAAVSLNLVLGQCGQFSIGHAAFMAIGGYTAALLATQLLPFILSDPAWAARLQVDPENPLLRTVVTWINVDGHRLRQFSVEYTWLGRLWPVFPLLLGGTLAALAGWLIGMPCLRLRGDYLAIVTLGLGEILRVTFENTPALGGSNGITGIPRVMTPGWVFCVTVLSVYFLANLVRSTLGKAFLTLREDDVAAETVGINTTRYKVQSFTIGAFFAGVAGAMLAHVQTGVVPRNASWVVSFELIAMVVLGGSGSVTGAVLAALVLRFLPEGLRALNDVELVRTGEAAAGAHVTFPQVVATIVILVTAGLVWWALIRRQRRTNPNGWLLAALIVLRVLSFLAAGFCGLFLLARSYGINLEEFRVVIYALLLIIIMLLRPQGLLGRAELPDLWRRKTVPGGAAVAGAAHPGNEPSRKPDPAFAGPAKFQPLPEASPADELANQREPLLQCQQLTIRFGGLLAVDNFHLNLYPGELLGLIGPNGAGKTTVFNMLTGVYAPTAGKIVFARHRVDGLRPCKLNARGIARTFQNIRLFANLSVLDNVRIARHVHLKEGLGSCVLRLPGFYREEKQTRDEALMLLDLFGLTAVAGEPAGSLPYGDQRRLEIARALATRPWLLLLDEPAAGMNPQEKMALSRMVTEIGKRFRLTILLIEHDMKLVMGLCRRIMVLDHGQTIAEGPPEKIQNDPRVIEAYLGEPVKAEPKP